ncbi:hypothetical protein BH23ACT4_BH23ACT4_14090 [soil metagenome]
MSWPAFREGGGGNEHALVGFAITYGRGGLVAQVVIIEGPRQSERGCLI